MKKASLLVGLALAVSGCAPSYVTDNNAPVFLRIVAFDPPILQSDVQSEEGTIAQDDITVSLAVRAKNPNVTVPQVPIAVFMERYEVRYFRSDNRNAEGVDVPYRISGPMAGVIDAQDSGSSEFTLELVRRQAKLDPPLRNLSSNGGAIVVTVFAEITVHGRTTAGQAVSDTARVQIDFGDFAG